MTAQFHHERLRAYQEAVRFVAWVGPLIEGLPARLAARDQMDRSSTSVVLNIAEGNGKRSKLERCRFFDIARGSAVECAACLDVMVARGKIDATRISEGKDILLEVVKMMAGLIAHFSQESTDGVAEPGGPYDGHFEQPPEEEE